MSNRKVLVLGSKPNSYLPHTEVNKIYTANGAAEKADYFRKNYSNNTLTCICGAAEFARNEHVSKRIINSKPTEINNKIRPNFYARRVKKYTQLNFIAGYDQWKFQSVF